MGNIKVDFTNARVFEKNVENIVISREIQTNTTPKVEK